MLGLSSGYLAVIASAGIPELSLLLDLVQFSSTRCGFYFTLSQLISQEATVNNSVNTSSDILRHFKNTLPNLWHEKQTYR